MTIEFERKTVAKDVLFNGKGLHSGNPVDVAVKPGDDGIWFRCGKDRIKACPNNVSDTSRCTILGPISTIEHMMAALAGCEITDAEVELSSPEMPALDGASGEYTKTILATGSTVIGIAACSGPYARVFVQENESKVAIAAGSGHWKFDFISENRWPFHQTFETESVHSDFNGDIASARTFDFEENVPLIQAAGLARGLNLDTALILGKDGYVNAPQFQNEPARHKMLDMIGDLYLSGVPIRLLSVAAVRSGHWLNVKAAKVLSEAAKIEFVS